ncbi:39S ribosomal protein L46, mitochondrial [Monomorium pharaonis]|uniref:39S ribosomal protein L46, mitochondrial n=1 Tax=Monomorium pharaonis TaxID=307658 RepID=UPI00063F3C58|nr:39S ribosomal protein L46, mitochondrial [Monomorium pharaonis]
MLKQIFRPYRNLNQILPDGSREAAAIYPSVIRQRNARTFCTATAKRKWDLYSAVCLERHPVIIKPMQEIELKFHNILKKIEYENSLKSDHELKKEKEEKSKSVQDDADTDRDAKVQTLQDIEESYQEELDSFKFAPTITEFDEQNITLSLNRKLDKNLLLLVQQKVGNSHYWIPPQGIRKEGETMRQTAERVLQDTCGAKIKVKFYGNAPIGFYKYKYPKKLCEQESYGAKVFYFLAKHIDGDVTNDVKYQWLDHEEFKKVLPNGVQRSISQFMLFT